MSQTTTESIETLDFSELPTITLQDRCEGGCQQHAKALVEIATDSLLYFCGHHWRKHRPAILDKGYRYYVDPAEDKIFTNRLRNEELAASGVNGRA